jgi:response regulator of citrate/malate metabolism
MKQGRPRATGIFETNEELVTAALERHDSGKSMRLIAQILKVSHTTIEKIIKENRSA